MEVRLTITFDSYNTLSNILDDCRVLRLTRFDYSRLMDVTLDLEHQATRKKRVADTLSLMLDVADCVCLRECVMSAELYGCYTRTPEEVKTLRAELDWSYGLADALIAEGL